MDFSRAVLGSEHLMKQKKIKDLENIYHLVGLLLLFLLSEYLSIIKWIFM